MIESRDGRYVFTAAFAEFRLGIFERDSHDGSLTFVRAVINGIDTVGGLRGAIGLAVSGGEDDEEGDDDEGTGCGHLYTTGFRSNSVDAFTILDCGHDDEGEDD